MKKKTITLCSSVSFYKELFEIERELKKLGFKVLIPKTAYVMKKTGNYNPKSYKTWYKNKDDYKIKTRLLAGHNKKVVKGDAILVVNLEKNGMRGYIGGNVLIEMGLAFHFKKPIFLYESISEKLNIKEEVYALNPIFIKRNLSIVKRKLK